MLLAEVLSSWGYAVSQARSGAEALVCLREETFDALLTDLEMPVITGFVLVRQLRAREQRLGTPRLFVIAISGRAKLIAQGECARLGLDHVISKPFDWDSLRDVLRKLTDSGGGSLLRLPLDVPPEVRSLLPSFFASRQADYLRMVSALERHNFDEIDQLGHRLKGSGGSFGFPELSTIGELLELAAREADADRCAQALGALEATLRDAVSRAA